MPVQLLSLLQQARAHVMSRFSFSSIIYLHPALGSCTEFCSNTLNTVHVQCPFDMTTAITLCPGTFAAVCNQGREVGRGPRHIARIPYHVWSPWSKRQTPH